jgi:hypothetical protein
MVAVMLNILSACKKGIRNGTEVEQPPSFSTLLANDFSFSSSSVAFIANPY